MAIHKQINPHPGEILLERLAMELRVPTHRVNEIVHGRRSITADSALRLAKFFGTTPDFWLNLQKSYDLAAAQEELKTELSRIRTIEPAFA